MYQKEIIYLGLYKDGSRRGSAGFLKVENRERESRLYLKIQNVPLGINGRFPIRVYDGNGWKEIKGVSVQDGIGSWEEVLPENVEQTVIQVILPGGYMLQGKSKYASETIAQRNAEEEKEIRGYDDAAIQNPVSNREDAAVQDWVEERSEAEVQRNVDGLQDEAVMQESGAGEDTAVQDDMEGHRDTEVRQNTVSRQAAETTQTVGGEYRNVEIQPDAASKQDMQEIQKDRVEERRDVEIQRNTVGHRNIDVIKVGKKREETAFQNHMDTMPVKRTSGENMTKDMRKEPQTIIITEELPRRASGSTVVVPQSAPEYSLKEDKWEQILDTYERIHPYGDERIYVKLEPKDFVILQSKYQHLVNNSFLLHGFYNYRYIILGKEQDYYLGVPGVFYEREKMVAVMFGFEAFECPGGNVRAGEFGYYLRKVEL